MFLMFSISKFNVIVLEVRLSSLKQILATGSHFKMIKNAFHVFLKTLFVLEIFRFLFLHFGHLEKRLVEKAKVNFEACDVTNWVTDNDNTFIARYLKR